jgi:Domain of unknown function (DUF4340)
VTITLEKPASEGGKKPEPVQHVLVLGKPVEGAEAEYYARLDNGPGVFVLGAAVAAELTRTHLDFVNRTLLDRDAGQITALQRHTGPDTLELAKRDDGWHLTKPAELRADDQTLHKLVDALAHLRAQRVAAHRTKDLAQFGLSEPAAVWTLRSPGGEGKMGEHILKIGKEESAETGNRFVLVEGAETVGVLPRELVRPLLAAPVAFRERTLARFADADRITLERGTRKAVFAKVDGNWKLTDPVTADAEQFELEDFLSAVARLRADELVADKPANLKPYGLDRPEARWQLRNGDKEVLDLLVGAQEKEGPRRYAKLASGNLVFLLDPGLTAKVLAEYRNRTVWPNLDAAQVERLEYRSKDQPFALERVDNTWRLTGKADAKVNAEAVQQALDALAGLKAAQYVEDQSKELPLYGLEPPELVLEIHTRTGKRALHVGRRQGETQRYYARVPEGAGATAVFVLGEGDAQRVVRPPSAFTQGKP